MPKKKQQPKPTRTCGQCIHEYACGMWNVGNLRNTDATHCTNYETLSDIENMLKAIEKEGAE